MSPVTMTMGRAGVGVGAGAGAGAGAGISLELKLEPEISKMGGSGNPEKKHHKFNHNNCAIFDFILQS